MKWIQDLHSNYNEFNDTYINYFTDLCLYAFRSYLASSLYILGVNRWHCGSVSLIKAYYMCRYLQCYFYTALKRGCFGGSVDTIFKVLFCIYQKKKSQNLWGSFWYMYNASCIYMYIYNIYGFVRTVWSLINGNETCGFLYLWISQFIPICLPEL